MKRLILWQVLDGLWWVALAAYILVGYNDVPFHGDESTLVYMSGDYFHLFYEHDLDRVMYSDTHDPAEQYLRVLNGSVGKMVMGVAEDLAGFTAKDLNQQWGWGLGWDWNAMYGHIPSDRLLRVARLSSTVMLILSAWAIFGITRRVAGNRPAAWAASAIYVTTPAVLLNGRRAMFEGSFLCFTLLTVWVAVILARGQGNSNPQRWLVRWSLLLGLCGGLALASKHTAAVAVGAVFFALFTEPLVRLSPTTIRQRLRQYNWRWLARYAGAGLVVIVVFLALNPVWWSDWPGMPARVLKMRRDLLNGQVAQFGGYENAQERLVALVRNTFVDGPQYYESPDWAHFIPDQIARYDGRWFAGRGGGVIWGSLLMIAFTSGLAALGRRWREGVVWVVLAWLVATVVVLLLTVPLDWQRYYIPIQAVMAVVAGAGIGWGVKWVGTKNRTSLPHRRHRYASPIDRNSTISRSAGNHAPDRLPGSF